MKNPAWTGLFPVYTGVGGRSDHRPLDKVSKLGLQRPLNFTKNPIKGLKNATFQFDQIFKNAAVQSQAFHCKLSTTLGYIVK